MSWATILIFSIAIIGFFSSCTSTRLPTPRELTSIQGGKLTIVLLRITCEWKDGTPVEPFQGWYPSGMINIGLGSFLVGGKVERVHHRFISPETRKQGWTYLILEPGIHHLVFQGPQGTDMYTWNKQLRYGPRFQVNIPMNNQLVYVGTLHIYCHREWIDILGKKYCEVFNESRMDVRNEEGLVEEVANDYLSDFESPQTLLMQRLY